MNNLNNLTKIVKEVGISKIILDYKEQFENITFCCCCKEKFDRKYYNMMNVGCLSIINQITKSKVNNICEKCMQTIINGLSGWGEDFLNKNLVINKYSDGRGGVWRKQKYDFLFNFFINYQPHQFQHF